MRIDDDGPALDHVNLGYNLNVRHRTLDLALLNGEGDVSRDGEDVVGRLIQVLLKVKPALLFFSLGVFALGVHRHDGGNLLIRETNRLRPILPGGFFLSVLHSRMHPLIALVELLCRGRGLLFRPQGAHHFLGSSKEPT